MILAERWGRLHQVFLSAIALVFAAVAMLGFTSTTAVFYLGLWVFFVGFNYLEATLPSLVSKTVFAGGKGTAMGVYSTCQFLGAFAGGAAGGWILQYMSVAALISVCLVLAALWWLLVLPAGGSPVLKQDQLPDT